VTQLEGCAALTVAERHGAAHQGILLDGAE
jgi:hypothetical protein